MAAIDIDTFPIRCLALLARKKCAQYRSSRRAPGGIPNSEPKSVLRFLLPKVNPPFGPGNRETGRRAPRQRLAQKIARDSRLEPKQTLKNGPPSSSTPPAAKSVRFRPGSTILRIAAIQHNMNNIKSDSAWTPVQIQPGLITIRRFHEQVGVVPSTVWRWIQRGWLGPCNISGRLYLTREQIAEFKRRAVAGEFAVNIRPPRSRKGS
jgi:hypothetical protein